MTAFKTWAVSFLAMSAWALASGCQLNKSKVKALQSKDWNRNGVDRFYLAVGTTGAALEGSKDLTAGQEMIFGLGCFGESKDPRALSWVKDSSCPGGKAQIALNDRSMMAEFPMAADEKNPKAGECVMLMGDNSLLKNLNKSPKEFASGASGDVVRNTLLSVGVCGMTLALVLSPTMHAHINTATQTAVRNSATGAEKGFDATLNAARSVPGRVQEMLFYFSNGPLGKFIKKGETQTVTLASDLATKKVMYTNSESILGRNTAAGALLKYDANPALQKGATTAAKAGLTALPCGAIVGSVWGALAGGQVDDNRKVFFNGLAEGEALAAKTLKSSLNFLKFQEYVGSGKMREAAAIYNPIFVREFNKNVNGQFEQGWGGFDQQKFFNTVRDIQKELGGNAVAQNQK